MIGSNRVTTTTGMANNRTPDVPPFVIKNLITLLDEAGPNGCPIGALGQNYFTQFNNSLYVEKYGFKTWGHMLTCPAVKAHCTVFNSGQSVRSKKFDPPSTSSDNVQVLTPIPSTSAHVSSSTHGIQLPSSSRKTEEDTGDSTSAMDSDSVATSGTRGSRKRHRPEGDYAIEGENASESEASEFTDITHVSITPANKAALQGERQCIKYIGKEAGSTHLDFNTLVLERELKSAEPAMYIDCTYCDRDTLEKLMDVKSLIKKVSTDRFAEIRNKHNKFESERVSIFQHGTAIKMANIDALMGYALTNPKTSDGSNMLGPNELLYFADVNGGPGGVAEYFLWKKKWQAKGFGISPRGGKFDYNLQPAEHYSRESFEVFYGEDGAEGSGNIGRPIYLSKFISFVKESTEEKGVHVMVGSGGDTDEYVDEDQKEIRCKYTFMSQFLLALKIVRPGGHYVSRIYDMYTAFTVELVYLMYRTFEQVAIFKPESSLPASSEKYIICKWRKNDFAVQEISNYLSECHKMDWLTRRNTRNKQEFAEIVHFFHPNRIVNSHRFYQYIRNANNELGRRQVQETTAMSWNIRNNTYDHYIEKRLAQILNKSLALWGVPTKVREKPKYSSAKTPKVRALKLLTPYPHDFLNKTECDGEATLFKNNLAMELKRPKEWRFVVVGRERGFFLCLGGSQIYKLSNGNWVKIKENMELMNNTLVYADLVDELYVAGAKQSSVTALHIIDAVVLGSKDIRMLPYSERYELIQKYSASLNKISRNDLAPIRGKISYDFTLTNIQRALTKIKPLKSRGVGTELVCPIDIFKCRDAMFNTKGILFIKVLKENFASVDFRFCIQNRVFWHITTDMDLTVPEDFSSYTPKQGMVIKQDENGDDKPLIHAVDFLQYMHELATAGAAK